MAREEQVLMPGLPDDIAFDCIARVPHRQLPRLRAVCRRWRDLIPAASFRRHRQRIGAADDLIFLVQALVGDPASDAKVCAEKPSGGANLRPPSYALSVFYPGEGSWLRVASPDPIPMFAQCAAVDGKLVLVGGWDPMTLDPVRDVRILDLCTGAWRRGRAMPTDRSFFACAALSGRVYVAGGHDGMKNALRTAEVYDLGTDEWSEVPEMGDERDECKGVSIGGRFWAISGYGTDSQGRFDSSAECFDPATGSWVKVEGVWPEDGAAYSCFAGGRAEEGLWCLGKRGMREYRVEGLWGETSPVPEKMNGIACAVCNGAKVFVMGSSSEGSYGGWALDMGRPGKWMKVDTPVRFSGFAYSAAASRI